jgi:hypothetical protein
MDQVLRIEPRTREVHLSMMPNKDLHVPLLELSKPSFVRVVSPCMLPAFTETLVEVRTDRSDFRWYAPPATFAMW